MITQKKIAITGGIGSGKSTVAQILREKGFPVFSCDEIYREITQDYSYIQTISVEFPEVVKDGEIDRALLSSLVFNDENKRKKLNSIAHPLVVDALLQRMNTCNTALVFAEVPLLFEGGFERLFDAVFVVVREHSARIQAVQARDGLNATDITARMNAQFDYESEENQNRLNNSNVFLLKNDDSLANLNKNVEDIIQKII